MKSSSAFRKYKEILLGAGMLALASFYLYHATLIKTRSTVSVSARLIPEILGIIVVVLGVSQIVVGVRYLLEVRRTDRASGTPSVLMNEAEKRSALPVFLTFVLIIGYALVFEPLGFVIASTLCMFLQMFLLSPRSKLRPVYFVLISFVVAVVVYVAFRKGLNLTLPQGLLERFRV